MPVIEPIPIDGLRALARRLREVDAGLPKAMRLAANEAAEIVVTDARGRMPRRSGRAAASVKAKSTRTAARVTSGGNRAPYTPWLDYGGKVGPNGSVTRPFRKGGRYVYPAFEDNRDKVETTYREALDRIIADAGLDTD